MTRDADYWATLVREAQAQRRRHAYDVQPRLLIRCALLIERALRRYAMRADELADCFALCPSCGRNRYTGASCVDEARPPDAKLAS